MTSRETSPVLGQVDGPSSVDGLLGWEPSGVWYCRRHNGMRNEDEPHADPDDFCSWRDDSQMSYEQNGDVIDGCDWTELFYAVKAHGEGAATTAPSEDTTASAAPSAGSVAHG